jgi:hypothetical protein
MRVNFFFFKHPDSNKERLRIKEPRTFTPHGLNYILDGRNWRYRSRDDHARKKTSIDFKEYVIPAVPGNP